MLLYSYYYHYRYCCCFSFPCHVVLSNQDEATYLNIVIWIFVHCTWTRVEKSDLQSKLVEKLKSHQWSLFNPVIIIHAFQYRDLYTCNDNGCHVYLVKPDVDDTFCTARKSEAYVQSPTDVNVDHVATGVV